MKSGLGNFAEGCVAQLVGRSPHRTAIVTPFRWLPLLLLCAMIMGCAGINTSEVGTPARPDNRHPLAATGGEPELWKSKDIALHYTTVVNNDAVGIKGTVERLNTIKHFVLIKHFRVSIHFLNADGIILNTQLLWTSGTGQDTKFVRWTFDKNFPLPVGATAIGFSYRGSLFDNQGEGAGRSGWDVLQRP